MFVLEDDGELVLKDAKTSPSKRALSFSSPPKPKSPNKLSINVKLNSPLKYLEDMFEQLYDDVYEVTLPNTLWGVHRDPERQFIVFTYFCTNEQRIIKSFLLDASHCIKLSLNSKKVSIKNQKNPMTVEKISDCLLVLNDFNIDDIETNLPNGIIKKIREISTKS